MPPLMQTIQTGASDRYETDASPAPGTDAATPVTRRSRPRAAEAQRDALYLEFTPLIHRLMRQYGSTQEIRDDLRSGLYCRFCDLLQSYDPARGVPLRPYLVRLLSTAAYDIARSHWRLQQRERVWDTETAEVSRLTLGEDPTATWDDTLQREQIAAGLPAAIARLPERQRQVIVWRYFDDCSFEEIAGRLGVQTATARSLMRHGMVALRRRLVPAQG